MASAALTVSPTLTPISTQVADPAICAAAPLCASSPARTNNHRGAAHHE
jgi:hypothetical protein